MMPWLIAMAVIAFGWAKARTAEAQIAPAAGSTTATPAAVGKPVPQLQGGPVRDPFWEPVPGSGEFILSQKPLPPVAWSPAGSGGGSGQGGVGEGGGGVGGGSGRVHPL
jgi:hypothetical protein